MIIERRSKSTRDRSRYEGVRWRAVITHGDVNDINQTRGESQRVSPPSVLLCDATHPIDHARQQCIDGLRLRVHERAHCVAFACTKQPSKRDIGRTLTVLRTRRKHKVIREIGRCAKARPGLDAASVGQRFPLPDKAKVWV